MPNRTSDAAQRRKAKARHQPSHVGGAVIAKACAAAALHAPRRESVPIVRPA